MWHGASHAEACHSVWNGVSNDEACQGGAEGSLMRKPSGGGGGARG